MFGAQQGKANTTGQEESVAVLMMVGSSAQAHSDSTPSLLQLCLCAGRLTRTLKM